MSIQRKVVIIFSIIIVVVFLSLNIAMTSMVRADNEQRIYSDLQTFKQSSQAYIEQTFRTQKKEETGENFAQLAAEIGEGISDVMGRDMGLFTSDGTPLFHTSYMMIASNTGDLANAINGIESYTIVQGSDKTSVYYSYPIMEEGEIIGILRVMLDYTRIFSTGLKMTNMVLYTSVILLLIAFILLLVFLRSTIRPIRQLTRSIRQMTADPQQSEVIEIKQNDEIGQLAMEYNKMSSVIKRQIETIEKERDTLKKLLQFRKDFFDNVTHELKTPLTVIIGYAELIKENQLKDKELAQKGISHIMEESERLRNMVTDMLELSRDTVKIEEEFKPVSIWQTLEHIVESMNIKAKRYGSYIVLEGNKELKVLGSREKLRQLFVNLIDNAIKYGEPGKPICVQMEKQEKEAVIGVANYAFHLNQDDIDKMFERYYSSTPEELEHENGSVGLGLGICKNITAMHGGKITVQFMEDHRICFEVRLPKMEQE